MITLETRLDVMPRQIEAHLPLAALKSKRGWKAIVGTFADDPCYDEAMRLGHKWRESQYDETDYEEKS